MSAADRSVQRPARNRAHGARLRVRCTLGQLRVQTASSVRGATLFPALCARYTPGAWPRLSACYPVRRPNDEAHVVSVLLAAIEEHDVFPIMDEAMRAWTEEERRVWAEEDADEEGNDLDGATPFWVRVIPLTNSETLYTCDPEAASTVELLLAALIAGDMDDREQAADEAAVRLAHLAGDVAARATALLAWAESLHRTMVTAPGGGLLDPLYEALCRDAARVFRLLPEPLYGVPTLCSYMDGTYDNPFLCPSYEMWEATGLDCYEWSLENVETCAAWWADARPIVVTARALQGALREPGALERVLPALTSALAYACHAAGYDCPPGLVPPVPISTRYG